MNSLLTNLADELLVQDITEPVPCSAHCPMMISRFSTITSSNSSPSNS